MRANKPSPLVWMVPGELDSTNIEVCSDFGNGILLTWGSRFNSSVSAGKAVKIFSVGSIGNERCSNQ